MAPVQPSAMLSCDAEGQHHTLRDYPDFGHPLIAYAFVSCLLYAHRAIPAEDAGPHRMLGREANGVHQRMGRLHPDGLHPQQVSTQRAAQLYTNQPFAHHADSRQEHGCSIWQATWPNTQEAMHCSCASSQEKIFTHLHRLPSAPSLTSLQQLQQPVAREIAVLILRAVLSILSRFCSPHCSSSFFRTRYILLVTMAHFGPFKSSCNPAWLPAALATGDAMPPFWLQVASLCKTYTAFSLTDIELGSPMHWCQHQIPAMLVVSPDSAMRKEAAAGCCCCASLHVVSQQHNTK